MKNIVHRTQHIYRPPAPLMGKFQNHHAQSYYPTEPLDTYTSPTINIPPFMRNIIALLDKHSGNSKKRQIPTTEELRQSKQKKHIEVSEVKTTSLDRISYLSSKNPTIEQFTTNVWHCIVGIIPFKSRDGKLGVVSCHLTAGTTEATDTSPARGPKEQLNDIDNAITQLKRDGATFFPATILFRHETGSSATLVAFNRLGLSGVLRHHDLSFTEQCFSGNTPSWKIDDNGDTHITQHPNSRSFVNRYLNELLNPSKSQGYSIAE